MNLDSFNLLKMGDIISCDKDIIMVVIGIYDDLYEGRIMTAKHLKTKSPIAQWEKRFYTRDCYRLREIMGGSNNYQASNYSRRQEKFANAKNKVTTQLNVKYHSTQINLDEFMSEKDYRFYSAVSSLSDDAIHDCHPYQNDFDNGRERCPHITILYGLINEQDYFPIRKLCGITPSIEVEVGNIKTFRNPNSDSDVVVHEILSDGLCKLNKEISKFQNQNSYPDYNPHMTLAYIKKGALLELDGESTCLTGAKFTIDSVSFSHIDGYELDMPLRNSSE